MFWRTQTKLKGLTPANGISPIFSIAQKTLADSNNINAGIDLRKEAIAAVRTSTNIETGRPDKTGLFDGGKELTSRGAGYRLMADQGTPRDAQGEIIVMLYDPVTIEAIVLD